MYIYIYKSEYILFIFFCLCRLVPAFSEAAAGLGVVDPAASSSMMPVQPEHPPPAVLEEAETVVCWAFCDAITVHHSAEFEERESVWSDGYRGQDRFDFFNGALDDVVGKYWKVCDVHRGAPIFKKDAKTILSTKQKSSYPAQVIRSIVPSTNHFSRSSIVPSASHSIEAS